MITYSSTGTACSLSIVWVFILLFDCLKSLYTIHVCEYRVGRSLLIDKMVELWFTTKKYVLFICADLIVLE